MILRSVIRHVRDQNWFAVGLDFLIVVVGVFIGIQVANWNDERIDRERGAEYMERIAIDLDDDAHALQQRIAYWRKVVEQGRIALAHAEGISESSDAGWPVLRAYLQAAEVWRFANNITTYSEVRSAGDLSLIGDADLRATLADYYVTNAVRRAEGLYRLMPDYRETIRGAVPSKLMRYYWEACHEDDRTSQRLLPCEGPIPDSEANAIANALPQVPGLLPELRYWIDSLSINIRLATLDRDGAQSLAQRIRKATP